MRDNKKKVIKRFTSKMQASLLLIFFLVIIVLFIMVFRLYKLNNEDGERYEKRVLSQQTYMSNPIPYKRGDILDRNMTKLAVSEKVYNLILDPFAILEKEEYKEPTLTALNTCFGLERDEINKILEEKSESRYVQMKDYKGLDFETVEIFENLVKEDEEDTIKGVWFEAEYVRRYPLNTVGSSVIGFTQKGDSNIGTWGIEEFYNEELSGSNGREYGYFNAELKLERTVKPAVNGNNIISTIDSNVQKVIEQKVGDFLKEPGAENVAVLLMNPQNGEIYSMVSNETFDLNNPRDLSARYAKEELDTMTEEEMSAALSGIWRNFCISHAYEPGSTFKPFTVAAALDENVVTEKNHFSCSGSLTVGDKKISCNSIHGDVSLIRSLMDSCNVALMEIGAKLGKKSFGHYTKLLGFGEKTGIDLPGEAVGITYNEDTLKPVDLATCSFGQSNTVTMVQMAAGFSSLINGGNYYKPHIVKEVQNENGATITKFDKNLIKKTISQNTSNKIREYLYDTVESGTAAPAKVEGYEIGGKTGTAEKIPRDKINYIVSFIGFAPVENPQVVIYVVIDQPHVPDQPHSTIATIFASEIMEAVLPFLGVYPNTTNNIHSTEGQSSSQEGDTSEKDASEEDTADEDNTSEEDNISEEDNSSNIDNTDNPE